jgi:hypothetical protein
MKLRTLTPLIVVGVTAAILLTLVSASDSAQAKPSTAADGTIKFRYLLLYGDDQTYFDENATHLANEFVPGKNSDGTVAKVTAGTKRLETLLEFEGLVATAFNTGGDKPDDDDVSVLYMTDHGVKMMPADKADEPASDTINFTNGSKGPTGCTVANGKCDELFVFDNSIKEKPSPRGILDQEIPAAFNKLNANAGVAGKKVLIFQHCASGGMFDPGLDRLANSFYLSASTSNQESFATLDESHSFYTTKLIGAFEPKGVGANANKAKADADNNNIVTVNELVIFANGASKANPQAVDAGAGGATEIFRYDPNVTPLVTDTHAPAGEVKPECGSCCDAVGGIAGLADEAPAPAGSASGSANAPSAPVAAALAAAVLALGAGGWYARRRRVR